MHQLVWPRTAQATICAALVVCSTTFAGAADDVAYIGALNGEVTVQRAGSAQKVPAVRHLALHRADVLATAGNARADITLDAQSALRLGAGAQLRLGNHDAQRRDLQLAAGTVVLRTFGDDTTRTILDTPSVAVVALSAGSVRVSVGAGGQTAVTVRAGRADIVTPQGTQSLAAGTTLLADGASAKPAIRLQPAIALDGFDAYNGARDRVARIAVAAVAQPAALRGTSPPEPPLPSYARLPAAEAARPTVVIPAYAHPALPAYAHPAADR